MSWDETLFSLVWSGAKALGRKRVPEALLARRVEVEPERERLEALARLLTGAALEVVIADDGGGVEGGALVLPRFVEFAPTRELNRAALTARLAWSATLAELERPPPSGEPLLDLAVVAPRVRALLVERWPSLGEALPELERAAAQARPTPNATDARALAIEAAVRLGLGARPSDELPETAWSFARAALAGERPPLPRAPGRRWRTRAPLPPVPLWGELPRRLTLARALRARSDDAEALPEATGEAVKPTAKRARRVEEPDELLDENPLIHSFEKVHTLDTYKGGSKRVDGDDELGAHQKALDELDLREVVRSHRRAKSLYRAELLLDGSVGEVDDDTSPAEALYDEWDESRKSWRRGWCRLTTRVTPVAPGAEEALRELRARLARTTLGLRAVFEALESARAWKLRQLAGTDVDLDAVVARYGALRAGECSERRLYATRRRHSRDLAVLLLLDTSLSTDAWVMNRRVLDVEKEAVIALGDALDGLVDQVAVASFSSQSRRDCRFAVARSFDEPWAIGAQRVVSLEPAGFTRIGPAVRHATTELLARGARQKLLLIVSDGKPSDVDRYEGRYGMADVRRAVLDAQSAGVVTHALAVDPAAKGWLPSMFGHGRASVVTRPEELVDVLARVTGTALRAA
ncbi:MAG: VWA domain-containing protein [Sorangiineae bacterium]|nr:VWA domain-containing protein [Polyangiaceae bacterium]MEB2324464.1 VWA domain-containing protein [Sorangiineae bacterium]